MRQRPLKMRLQPLRRRRNCFCMWTTWMGTDSTPVCVFCMTPIVSAAEDGVKARQLSVVDVTCDANDVRVRVLGSGTRRSKVVEAP